MLAKAITQDPARLNAIWDQLREKGNRLAFRADVGPGDAKQDFLMQSFTLADEVGLLRAFLFLLQAGGITTDAFEPAMAKLFGKVRVGPWSRPRPTSCANWWTNGSSNPIFR